MALSWCAWIPCHAYFLPCSIFCHFKSFNHGEIYFFFPVWVLLPYRFWKNRHSWSSPAEAEYPQGPASPAQAGPRQPWVPHLSAAACQRATSRRPPLPSPPQSPGLRADFSAGKRRAPGSSDEPCQRRLPHKGNSPCPAPLRAPAGCKVNGEPPFRSPSPLRRNHHHHHYHTRRRGGPGGLAGAEPQPAGTGRDSADEAQLRRRGRRWALSGGAAPSSQGVRVAPSEGRCLSGKRSVKHRKRGIMFSELLKE